MEKNEVLKQVFGYDSFREGQETLIDGILSGRDVLGIMPTGAGKSICFQVPALMMPGITIVISPLISLMKDQVSALNAAGVHAAFINSSLTEGQYRKAMEYAKNGRYKIIYVAPERLMTESFLELIRNITVSMIAVDEAHCISQWGQDFRPSYLKIVDFIGLLPKRPVIAAYTATATMAVREDILCILGLEEPVVLVTGYDRKNLHFAVEKPGNRMAGLLSYLERNRGKSGIIYCNTRKTVDEVWERLIKEGYPAARYHAGMPDSERQVSQEDFIYDRVPIMVATNAFGMGIDKSDVRYVIHYNMPKDIESYYQEAGRAGRDGEPAECILYYAAQDVKINEFLIDSQMENGELLPEENEQIRERNYERLQKMTFYCYTNECLRDYILRYFGEYGNHYCGNCSNCLTQFETIDVTEIAKSLIGCVKTCRQRYGINVILDTVHGSNTAKVRQYGMESNPHYGEQKAVPVHRLRQIFNFLLLERCLALTNDAYTVVKLAEHAQEVLDGARTLQMKIAKEQEKTAKTGKKSRRGAAAGDLMLDGAGENLFERLRALRMEIARAEHVPPYIVFSDKTLVQMCAMRPKDRKDMLEVSGVGVHKFEKYGEKFLECIAAHAVNEQIGK